MATNRYLEVPVDEYGTILVELSPIEGLEDVSVEDMVLRVNDAFEKAANTISTCAKGIVSRFEKLDEFRPHEVEIEFGINMRAEMGAVIAKLTSEASYKVKLVWKEKATL